MKLTTFWGPLIETKRFCKHHDLNHNYYGCEDFQREFEQPITNERNGCWNCRLKKEEII